MASRLARRATIGVRRSSASQQSTFTRIFNANAWGDAESVSGPGSTLARGGDFHADFVSLLDAWHVRSLVDAPCGDFNWMARVLAERDLIYTGVDIVEALIVHHVREHAGPNRRFVCADMTRADLATADVIVCRDALVHLSFVDARAAIRNFRRSGSRYLLATTFVGRSPNRDVPTGHWRVLNMQAAPFGFPPPLALVDERCTRGGGLYRDKRLGLWDLSSIGR